MKVKLLKKLRKESNKLKLIRGEDYQYIVTDSPHDDQSLILTTVAHTTVVKNYYLTKM